MTLHRLYSRRQFLTATGLGALAVACGSGGGAEDERPSAGPPRGFQMGLSSLPIDPKEDSYREAFRVAGENGDLILIQRTPPWVDFRHATGISERIESLTHAEKELAKKHGLKLFLAVDPTEQVDRGRLAGLPPDLRGRDFSDKTVRDAFIAYARYLALNYKPAYLALGVEVDMMHARLGDAAFRNFQSLYFEAYDAVKEESEDTLVFPTFQYENLLGLLTAVGPTLPSLGLLNRFAPKLDRVAVSTYPGFVYGTVGAIPGEYYKGLTHNGAPFLIAATGWSSASRPGDTGNEGEGEQAAFASRLLQDVETLGGEAVVWFLGRDPVTPPAEGFAPLAQMGLFKATGEPKGALGVWRQASQRPLVD
jgi:hypothetical protein